MRGGRLGSLGGGGSKSRFGSRDSKEVIDLQTTAAAEGVVGFCGGDVGGATNVNVCCGGDGIGAHEGGDQGCGTKDAIRAGCHAEVLLAGFGGVCGRAFRTSRGERHLVWTRDLFRDDVCSARTAVSIEALDRIFQIRRNQYYF